MASKKENTTRKQNNNNDQGYIEKFRVFKSHFGRFAWDIIGIGSITIGLLFLIGLFDFTNDTILSNITDFLFTWIGLGLYLLIPILIISGISLLKLGRDNGEIKWNRIFWLELSLFLILAVFSIIGGQSFLNTNGELLGGRIGWSLLLVFHNLFGILIGNIVIILLWFLSLMNSFAGWSLIEKWLKDKVGDYSVLDDNIIVSDIKEDSASESEPVKKIVENKQPEIKKNLRNKSYLGKTKAIPIKDLNDKLINAAERGDQLPPLDLLIKEQNIKADERNINQTAGLLDKTLADFGIPAKVIGYRVGPTITQFAVEPGFYEKGDADSGDLNRQKVRIAQIAGLSRDLALALSAQRLRIEAPVPGKSYVGIEVPNAKAEIVRLRPILESESFYRTGSKLTVALGRDVSGFPVIADLSSMPHLLIAGTTGSGKSVCISSIAICLAMNNSPENLRMIMIDSKMVELIRFNGLPHLLGKVETKVERIMGVLRWTVKEMEVRYKLLEELKVRDLEAYNKKILKRKSGLTLPRIVVLIDELADLMMSSPDQTEHNLVRLAQMARATGIHLVVATQRPSTEVVTGVIKANFPARISFAVSSGIDSRVILDTTGAETLLGNGDMLFLNPEIGNPIRAQGVLITDKEIDEVINFWQKKIENQENRIPPWEKLLNEIDSGDEDDDLIDRAVDLIRKENRVSASLLQRRLRIGYPRAARLIDKLEEMGIVGPSTGGGRDRDVIADFENEESSE